MPCSKYYGGASISRISAATMLLATRSGAAKKITCVGTKRISWAIPSTKSLLVHFTLQPRGYPPTWSQYVGYGLESVLCSLLSASTSTVEEPVRCFSSLLCAHLQRQHHLSSSIIIASAGNFSAATVTTKVCNSSPRRCG